MRGTATTWIRAAAGAALLAAVAAGPAGAAPIAAVEYVEANLGGGLFRYDYTVRNLADPVSDAGFDLYDVVLFFSPAVAPVGWSLPAGWDLIGGAGFADAFSLLPGAAPLGSDIGPGQFLGGFRIVSDGRADDIAFQAVFTNPTEPANPAIHDGIATAQVSEPVAGLLFATGLAALALRRGRIGRHGSDG